MSARSGWATVLTGIGRSTFLEQASGVARDLRGLPGAVALKPAAAAADIRSMFDLEQALRRVIEIEGSDLHLKVPARPIVRVQGRLEPIPGSEPLDPETTEAIFR